MVAIEIKKDLFCAHCLPSDQFKKKPKQPHMPTSFKHTSLPTTLEVFTSWDSPLDGYKYEWFDGEVVRFEKMNKKHLKLIHLLVQKFYQTQAFQQGGALIAEQ